MTRSLAGSGALHALVLALLVVLTSPPRESASRAGGGFAVFPVRLEVSGAAARGNAAPAASGVAAAAAAPSQPQVTELSEPQRDPEAATDSTAAPGGGVEGGAAGPAAPPSGDGSGGGDGGGEGSASGHGTGLAHSAPPDAPPVPLHVAVPALPRELDASAAHGSRVRLLIAVSESGEVEGVNLLQSSGLPALDGSAVEAARKLRYLPATRDGIPVAAVTEAEIAF